MRGRPAVRRAGGQARRTRRIRRASAGLSPVRAGALLAMLLSAATIYGFGASSAFGYRRLVVEGDRYTGAEAIRALVAIEEGTNLFLVSTDDLERRLAGLPTVREAHATVALLDTIHVRLVEREPVLGWRVGAETFLVDADGVVFGHLAADRADDARLPLVLDRRAAPTGLEVGARIDPVDLDAATRLGSVRPADAGSAAASFAVEVTDDNGFVLRAVPTGWTAVFGFYTPTIRRPDIIPGQVRLLRSLVIGREPLVERVILASETDGTYVPRQPSPSP